LSEDDDNKTGLEIVD